MNTAYPWNGGTSSPVYQEWERQEAAAERSAIAMERFGSDAMFEAAEFRRANPAVTVEAPVECVDCGEPGEAFRVTTPRLYQRADVSTAYRMECDCFDDLWYGWPRRSDRDRRAARDYDTRMMAAAVAALEGR